MNKTLLEKLRVASRLETDLDFEDYRLCCCQLRGGDNPVVLGEMIGLLSDVEAGEIQYELIEACESFPDEVFCKVVMQHCESGYRNSPHWFDLMFCSMLNTERLFEQVVSESNRIFFAKQKIDEIVFKGEADDLFCKKWAQT